MMRRLCSLSIATPVELREHKNLPSWVCTVFTRLPHRLGPMNSTHLIALCFLITAVTAQLPSWSDRTTNRLPGEAVTLAMAYDEGAQRTVAFGVNRLSNTWQWDGSNWTLASTAGPSGRDYHRCVYDSRRQRIVMVEEQCKVWEWNGSR